MLAEKKRRMQETALDDDASGDSQVKVADDAEMKQSAKKKQKKMEKIGILDGGNTIDADENLQTTCEYKEITIFLDII